MSKGSEQKKICYGRESVEKKKDVDVYNPQSMMWRSSIAAFGSSRLPVFHLILFFAMARWRGTRRVNADSLRQLGAEQADAIPTDRSLSDPFHLHTTTLTISLSR